MGDRTFIGRQRELDEMLESCQRAADGRGGVVLLEAGAGTGKTSLLLELRRRLDAAGQQPAVRMATGRCFDDSSEHNAFQPFAEALVQLALAAGPSGGKRQARSLMVDLITQVAPDLIRLIPGLGSAVDPLRNAAAVTAQWWLNTDRDELAELTNTLPLQFVNAYVATAQSHGPLVLVIEDAHWCDRATAALLRRLALAIVAQPICLVVSYRPEELGSEHPLKRAALEMLRDGSGRRIRLHNFSPADVARYVGDRYGVGVGNVLGQWLEGHCGGNPFFVVSYLALLEDTGRLARAQGRGNVEAMAGDQNGWVLVGSLKDLPVPDTIEAVLAERVGQVTESERLLMTRAAVQGQEFFTTVVAQIVDSPDTTVSEALKEVESRVGLVAEREADESTVDWSDVFSFEHDLTRLAFYECLSNRQRLVFHAQVGEALSGLAGAERPLSRRLILETARHLSLGHRWLGAGANYRRAARSSYRDGALDVASQVAGEAFDCLSRCRDESPELDREKAKSIQLLMLSSELAWWDVPGQVGGRSPEALLDLGVTCARRADDAKLLAEMLFLRAKLTLLSGALPDAVELFQEATNLSADVGDGLGEVIGLTELGHAMAGLDLAKGLATQLKAYRLWDERLTTFETAGVASAALSRHLHRLQGTIGAAYFDSGEFGQAENWLKRALDGAQRHRMPDLISTVTVLAAQLYIATGRFEDAEMMLLDSLDASEQSGAAVVHNAYVNALLGKTYLEWERHQDALQPLVEAMSSTTASHNEAVLPLIRNYYADLLLSPATSAYDRAGAEELLHATLDATRRSGFVRSEVAALALLAEARRQAGDLRAAVSFSQQAVDRLDQAGSLPALRTEEVYFTHYRILAAAGDPRSAQYLNMARAELDRKAHTVTEPSVRETFLRAVPLSRRIQTG